MVGWQVFALLGPISRWVLHCHGAFSVDRESFDLKAFRQATGLLQHGRHPLVLFPEGEIYHQSDLVMPFRSGVAALAVTAARDGKRRIVTVPAAIRYEYLEVVTSRLLEVMTTLERRILLQPRPDLPLLERLARLAHAVLAIRELDFLGAVQAGKYVDRLVHLMDSILCRLERHHKARARDDDVPSRVTHLRHVIILQGEPLAHDDLHRAALDRDMEQLNVVMQLYSYLRDFDTDNSRLERQAEMVDKYEEDVLELPTATKRGDRRAIITFGQPLEVQPSGDRKADIRILTEQLETRVQQLLDDLHGRRRPSNGSAFEAAPGSNGCNELSPSSCETRR